MKPLLLPLLLSLALAGPAAQAQSSAGEVAAWRSAALAGSPDAAFDLYQAYRDGRQVPRDRREALHWLQIAARGGHAGAQFELAQALRNGSLGLASNPRQAYFWLLLAAREEAHAQAQQEAYEQGLTPNEIEHLHQQAQRWKPSGLPTRVGRVPLKDLVVPLRFPSEELTPDNYATVVRACMPTYPQAAIRRTLADWRFPTRGATTAIGTVGSASTLVVMGSTAVCVRQSEAGFPVWAAEALVGTLIPRGVPDTVRDGWYADIARLVATQGQAEVLFQLPNGNAYAALFRPLRGSAMRVEYRAALRRQGDYDPARYDAVFSHPGLAALAAVRYGGRHEKNILVHRLLPRGGAHPLPPAPALPPGRST